MKSAPLEPVSRSDAAAESQWRAATSESGSQVVHDVRRTVAAALDRAERVVLAISGGRDSMVMLDAAATIEPRRIAAAATFDHGTGPAATAACDLVEKRARALGLEVVRSRATAPLAGEVAWREARWGFLRAVATQFDAPVATAHTRDDQLETVLIRVLRGAGARGLAGLYAPSEVIRPLIDVPHETIGRYALARELEWIDDPSNTSRSFLRNRVRLDLLPALQRSNPRLTGELLELSARAARLRADVEQFVSTAIRPAVSGGVLKVARSNLLDYHAPTLRLLWPALAARIGATLDRRGTERLALFTIQGRRGGRIQLSAGFEAIHHRDHILLRAANRHERLDERRRLEDGTVLAAWRFRRRDRDNVLPDSDLWTAALPTDRPLSVREWRAGDRMVPHGATTPRRVKGLLRDADIDPARRTGWPVVLAGDEIVWVPGVRRGRAATDRFGRPALLFECERIDC